MSSLHGLLICAFVRLFFFFCPVSHALDGGERGVGCSTTAFSRHPLPRATQRLLRQMLSPIFILLGRPLVNFTATGPSSLLAFSRTYDVALISLQSLALHSAQPTLTCWLMIFVMYLYGLRCTEYYFRESAVEGEQCLITHCGSVPVRLPHQ